MDEENERRSAAEAMLGKLEPHQLAEIDQLQQGGHKAAAELLALYMGFCIANEAADETQAMLHYQLMELQVRGLPSQREAFIIIAAFCDMLMNEMLAFHDGIEGVKAAVDRGEPLLPSALKNANRQEEMDLFRRLEQL